MDSALSGPRVSVVVPAYNCAAFIGAALDSVFAQSFDDFEVLVVNDGSPDTAALEAALAPYLGRVRYFHQENRGPGGARNTGIQHARGELVAFLDSDDSWYPEFLGEQLRLLDSDPDVDLVYADAVLVGDTPLAGRTLMEGWPSQGEVTFERLVRLECMVFTSTVVARRQALVDAGLFDEQFYHSEDFDLWVRLVHRGGRIGYQRRVLGEHRSHGESLTAQPGSLLRAHVRICTKLLATLELSRERQRLLEAFRDWSGAQISLQLGKQELLAGRYDKAALLISDAYRVLGTSKLFCAAVAVRAVPRLLRQLYLWRHGTSTAAPAGAMAHGA